MNSRGLHRVQPTVWSPVRYDPEGVAHKAAAKRIKKGREPRSPVRFPPATTHQQPNSRPVKTDPAQGCDDFQGLSCRMIGRQAAPNLSLASPTPRPHPLRIQRPAIVSGCDRIFAVQAEKRSPATTKHSSSKDRINWSPPTTCHCPASSRPDLNHSNCWRA